VSSFSEPQLPSIAELEKVNFAPDAQANSSLPPYAEASDAKNLFIAFSATAKNVSRYRDPVLTRGAPGEVIFKSASPSVVAVVVGKMDKDDQFNPEGLGTGAIVDPPGYIITNWHVVNGYRGAIVFLKPTGGADLANAAAYGARLIYQEPTVDLALLKMIDPPPNLHALTVGDIGRIQVAEDIHIIGHPHGLFWSYSPGVVSQIRDHYTWSYEDGSHHEAKVLQLQTAINPGNSGGPVLDDSGNLLGLVAMTEGGQNLDYAIAADVIKRFLFTGMQMTTRGAQTSVSSAPPQHVLSGTLSNGSKVSKAIYSDAVLYVIFARDGEMEEQAARITLDVYSQIYELRRMFRL
jgi:S1-C subfamily serine protease